MTKADPVQTASSASSCSLQETTGSNTATQVQDGVSQAGQTNQSKLSGWGMTKLLAHVTIHNCMVSLNSQLSWKPIENQRDTFTTSQADLGDLSDHLLLLALEKGKQGKGCLLLVWKLGIGLSWNFSPGVQRHWQSVQILSLHLPMSGNNLHHLDISNFTWPQSQIWFSENVVCATFPTVWRKQVTWHWLFFV